MLGGRKLFGKLIQKTAAQVKFKWLIVRISKVPPLSGILRKKLAACSQRISLDVAESGSRLTIVAHVDVGFRQQLLLLLRHTKVLCLLACLPAPL